MKKILIALLIVIALAGAAVVGVGYYVYRQVRSTAAQFAALSQLPDIERGVRVRDAFVPPSSEELTEAQVQRLVRVQSTVRERLGARFADFEKKYAALTKKDQGSLTDAPAVIAAYGDLVSMWLDAKRSQIEALNEQGLSLEEYRWVRNQAYRALGKPFADLDIGKLVDDVRRGAAASDPARILGAFGEAGPEINRKLIDRVRTQLEENLALASFGL